WVRLALESLGAGFAPAHDEQTMCRINRRPAALHTRRDAQFAHIGLDFSCEFAQPSVICLDPCNLAHAIEFHLSFADHFSSLPVTSAPFWPPQRPFPAAALH